ncbi:MAG: hypothetical protein J6B48_02215 [Clostridia bacterium]|nr:hypothetical protein [Clostridia bacterium]
MTNSKTTKRALFSSVVALLLCFTMLLGTTFAWFTDSAASGSNVITAGNLDIVVEYTLDGENWANLDGATDLFQKGLWEPGHTEVVALRIKNNGTLALKYVANMNIVDETTGKTKDDKDIVLSDILTVSTLVQQAVDADGNANQIGDITLGLAFNGENSIAYENTATFKAGNVLRNDVMLQPGAAQYLIVKVDMAETVGNEANHNGTDIPTINFGINVLATQYTYENDSFGDQYDKDAEYEQTESYVKAPANAVVVSDMESLKAALANGGDITLAADIAITEALTVSKNSAIYGEMYTLTYADSYTGTLFNVLAETSLDIYSTKIDGNGEWTWKDNIDKSNTKYLESFNVTGTTTVTDDLFKVAGSLTLGSDVIVQNVFGTYEEGSTNTLISIASVSGKLVIDGADIANNVARIVDTSDASAVELKSGKVENCYALARDGALFAFNGNTVTMSEGFEIVNNVACARSGCIIVVGNGVFTMDGGKISDNCGDYWGNTSFSPTVEVKGLGRFVMNGGEITNNAGHGVSAILARWTTAQDEATVTLNGGSIKGNTNVEALTGGYDVVVRMHDANAKLVIGKNMIIDGTVSMHTDTNLTDNR